MIKNHDRSKWFGASDTHFVMGSWKTKTFAKWWATKLGFIKNNFQTKETMAGNIYEHKIAKAIEQKTGEKLILDRQIKKRTLRLRVNLDAETKTTIREIKTFKNKGTEWKLPKNYIMQVRVQMYIANKKGEIWAYPLEEKYYKNYFLDIDFNKLICFEIEQDFDFIKEYLKRIKYLKKCMKKGIMPKELEC